MSNLFYQLPIHGYAAINMSAIATINDAVGGVDVTPEYDFEIKDYSFKKGHSYLGLRTDGLDIDEQSEHQRR